MIKGNTKIQLFDAKTGAEVQCVEKHNMVTNAVSNLLNLPMDYQLYNTNFSCCNMANDCMPIATKGMAGIILHQNSMTENPDNVMPDWDNPTIGFAGGAYSGTNKYRGNYNSNESGNITGGRRHVWDFGTDKANGTISAVSLTSLDGGNVGCIGTQSDLYCAKYINSVAPNYQYATNCYARTIGEVAPRLYCGYVLSGTTLTLCYWQLEKSNEIHLLDSPTTSKFVNSVNITLPVNPSSWDNCIFADENGYLHIVDYTEANRTFKNILINLKTGEIASVTDTVIGQLPSDYTKKSDYSWRPMAQHGDYIYGLGYNSTLNSTYPYTIVAHSASTGEFIQRIGDNWSVYDIRVNGVINGALVVYGNRILSNLSYRSLYFENMNNSYWYYNADILYNYRSNLYPYFLSRYHSSSNTVCLNKFNPYIATINNLATPVVKTSAQTMKITYEITETTT